MRTPPRRALLEGVAAAPSQEATLPAFPVFIRSGDARAEVDRIIASLGLTPEEAGLHRQIYALQASQTVVMTTRRDAPLAEALRGRPEWTEPVEGEGGG